MNRARSLLSASIVLFATSALRAEPAGFRLKAGREAAASALGERTFQLHQRQLGVGRDARVAQLLDRFRGAPGAVRTDDYDEVLTDDTHVMVTAEGWVLDVRGEGDWVRYWNLSYAEGPENTPVSVEQRPTLVALDAIARPFIATALVGIVELGGQEQLEPWYSSHLISTVETIGGEREQLVYASKIVYTRTIDGVPVLGPGSKVVVHVAADGTPTGFDVDWSRFVGLSDQQSATPLVAIRDRATVLAAARGDSGPVVEDRFECGYYDTGARQANRAAPLQIACLSTYRSASTGRGFVDAIPAATTVRSDALWPEVAVLASTQ